jgi:hypothetical protein
MMTCVRQCGVLRVFSTPPSFLPQKKKESVTERLLSPLPLFFLSFSSVEDFCVPAVFFFTSEFISAFLYFHQSNLQVGFLLETWLVVPNVSTLAVLTSAWAFPEFP